MVEIFIGYNLGKVVDWVLIYLTSDDNLHRNYSFLFTVLETSEMKIGKRKEETGKRNGCVLGEGRNFGSRRVPRRVRWFFDSSCQIVAERSRTRRHRSKINWNWNCD